MGCVKGGTVSCLDLVSPWLRVAVLPEHGADIYSITDARTGVDLLFKAPAVEHSCGSSFHAPDSTAAWVDGYLGGWQLLMPSGGDACVVDGVEHPYHGEACRSLWSARVEDDGLGSMVTMTTRLRRCPLRLCRTVKVLRTEPALEVFDVIVNEGNLPLPAMWAQHIVFGGPFVSFGGMLETAATRFSADRSYDGQYNPMSPGVEANWPLTTDRIGHPLDLGRIPGIGERRQLLGYLDGFSEGAWFRLACEAIDLCVRVSWAAAEMPYLWLWEDLNGSSGYPWYQKIRAVGIEPASSAPAAGLAGAIAANTHRTIAAGGRVSLRVRLEVSNIPMRAPDEWCVAPHREGTTALLRALDHSGACSIAVHRAPSQWRQATGRCVGGRGALEDESVFWSCGGRRRSGPSGSLWSCRASRRVRDCWSR